MDQYQISISVIVSSSVGRVFYCAAILVSRPGGGWVGGWGPGGWVEAEGQHGTAVLQLALSGKWPTCKLACNHKVGRHWSNWGGGGCPEAEAVWRKVPRGRLRVARHLNIFFMRAFGVSIQDWR